MANKLEYNQFLPDSLENIVEYCFNNKSEETDQSQNLEDLTLLPLAIINVFEGEFDEDGDEEGDNHIGSYDVMMDRTHVYFVDRRTETIYKSRM